MNKKPLVLMILDGWGDRAACKDNAITIAHPIHFETLKRQYPHTLLHCSGLEVGLPAEQMGNSEVGHLNIGAGRIVYQEISRISNAIADKSFFENHVLLKAVTEAKQNQKAVHLTGLLSNGGVHSSMDHLFALLDLCHIQGVQKVYVHAFLDGRDVAPQSARYYIAQLESKMAELGLGRIATLGGRFYGMDRDNRWERVEKAYLAMFTGEGIKAANPRAAVDASYEKQTYDEFVEPVIITDENDKPLGLINDGDSVIFFNFRADRARQMTRAIIDEDFDGFKRDLNKKVSLVCMTQYNEKTKAPAAFLPQNLNNTLGEILALNHLKQLRIAETEKYAHVTFFFNGGVEKPGIGEDRVLIPSPKVETYDLKPEMSAYEVTDRICGEIDRDYYDVIVLNYANPDMVGHTGNQDAAVLAIKTVDQCLHKVVEKVRSKQGIILITADHGNCEMMLDPVNESRFTAHTTNRVPFILVSQALKNRILRENSALCDIAPTMLDILNIKKPTEMTGESIIDNR